MPRSTNRCRVFVEGEFYICLAAAIMFFPLRWLLAACVAAFFHECCHYIALRLCGARLHSLRVGVFGAVMVSTPLSAGRQIISSLSGPLGGLLLLGLATILPVVSVCALVQSAFNLLPIYPLDGGRVLLSTALLFMPPDKAQKLCTIVQNVAKIAVICTAVYFGFILRFGALPLIAVFLLPGKKTLQT